jgi:hypothetical protein
MSEETVGCGPEGVVPDDVLFEESVCSADDEDDARPVKKPRTGTAPVRSQHDLHASPLGPRCAAAVQLVRIRTA